MRGVNTTFVVFSAMFLSIAIADAGCGGASSPNQASPDASTDAGGVESAAANDRAVDDGMIDSAPQSDALADTASLNDADGQPDAEAGPCAPLGECSCGADAGACPNGCIRTVCGAPSSCACSAPQAICVDPQNGTCDCGFALIDNCVKPRSHCLCTSCADAPGAICVTDAEQSEVCSGSFRSAFACP
jgi:hypothetical protein